MSTIHSSEYCYNHHIRRLRLNPVTMLRIVFLVTLIAAVFADDCEQRSFPNSNSFVCVCNEIHCDNLPSSRFNLKDDDVLFFDSDISKYRLHKTTISKSFSDSSLKQIDIHVQINSADRKQSIIGFGGSFTDAFGINANKLSDHLKGQLVNDLFGENGLEYNVARVPIAGSDFSDRPYSYDDVPNDFTLEHFSLARDDFEYKLPYIKEAQKKNQNLFLYASPWAPPTWLKTNGLSEGLGILIGEPGSKYWKTWANYFVRFFDAYKANGVKFWGLTPQNEPNTGLSPGWKWNTLGFSGWMMQKFIESDLGPALNSSGYGDVNLMIFDEARGSIEEHVSPILHDKKAAQYVSGIAYHWYGFNVEKLTTIHDKFPDYFIMMTEACEGYIPTRSDVGVSMGNWTRAVTYAESIIDGLNHWSSGWVDWNMGLDENGGPNWAENYVDSPIIITESNEYYKQPMFYSMAHFSKFLPRGSVRVDHKFKEAARKDVKMTSFVTPDNHMVIVVLNKLSNPVQIAFDGFTEKTFVTTFQPESIRTMVTKLT